jgi:hypothetical protein
MIEHLFPLILICRGGPKDERSHNVPRSNNA